MPWVHPYILDFHVSALLIRVREAVADHLGRSIHDDGAARLRAEEVHNAE
jgi:hypothetical protein